MCIIIHNDNGNKIEPSVIENCIRMNPDGFGFYDLATHQLFRTLDMGAAEILLASDRPFVAHCRYATRGEVSLDNVHPFECADGSLLFHNGTVESLSDDGNDSKRVASMLSYVKKRDVAAFLSSFDSRFLLIRPDGTVVKTGVWHDDKNVSFSKANVLRPKTVYLPARDNAADAYQTSPGRTLVGVYGTLKHGHHNHPLLAESLFVADGWTADPMRLCVDGLPYLIENVHQGGDYVELEFYEVDAETLESLDRLEGHPDFYKRSPIMCETFDGEFITAEVYTVDESYDTKSYHSRYPAIQNGNRTRRENATW